MTHDHECIVCSTQYECALISCKGKPKVICSACERENDDDIHDEPENPNNKI